MGIVMGRIVIIYMAPTLKHKKNQALFCEIGPRPSGRCIHCFTENAYRGETSYVPSDQEPLRMF